ncbi:MAG TPA: TetR/AcrR family transcriptional regulator C-terminal domain-containing protein [Candidatus Dormibacteraeota bacterium]|jgi:TetR/AcrR family tetracycline transcriptional repressor|nr:TetR/AcrR family transcriptional regulator C-terminal domain-containing protein [Candidatus Dormibacteraeota bacterium]
MARRDDVLEAAIGLLDEVGLDGLTMRVLAGRLGVRASALYRHYASKQDLLDAMVAHLVSPPEGAELPPDPLPPWDQLLPAAATGAREVMLAHRDGARLLSTFHKPGTEALASFHALIGSLIAAGIDENAAAVAVDTVFAYVNGVTIEEQARKAGSPIWPRERRDRVFEEGLALIIAGIASTLP